MVWGELYELSRTGWSGGGERGMVLDVFRGDTVTRFELWVGLRLVGVWTVHNSQACVVCGGASPDCGDVE